MSSNSNTSITKKARTKAEADFRAGAKRQHAALCPLRIRRTTLKCPLMVDAVEKVENRTTPKISQMVIFGLLRRRDAL
jgi:hypothetical protein